MKMNSEVKKRLERWSKGEKAPPEKVQIYPTNKCNLNCIFCAQQNPDYGYDNELSRKRWLEVTEEITEMGINRVLISGGGEPFSEKKTTLNIMEKVKGKKVKGRLITNGTLLNKETARKIVEISWDTIIFSLDSPKASLHDKLRGKNGTFKKTVRGLKNLEKARKDADKPDIEVNYVLNNLNYKLIPEMIEFCGFMDINSINFEPLTINNPLDKKLKITKAQRKKLTSKIISKAEKISNAYLGLRTNLHELKEIKMEKSGKIKEEITREGEKNSSNSFQKSPCFEPWLWPKIEANGDLWPCSTCPTSENLQNKSFKEIWYGKVFQNFRNDILNHKLHDSCQNCVTTHILKNNKIRSLLE